MRSLLDPDHQPIDKLRYRIVDDPLWPTAFETGANVNLGPLVGISPGDVRVQFLIGDLYDITEWAAGMVEAGAAVQDIRNFVGGSDPTTLVQNNEFKTKCENLQKKLANMVRRSKARFDEPWGMVCLYWAAGSPQTAYAKAVARSVTVERGMPLALAAEGA